MHKTKSIWSDGIVAVQLLKCELTFLRKESGKVAAEYVQELACNETDEDSEPCKKRELDMESLPVSFIQGGSQRWCISEEHIVRGYQFEYGKTNMISRIREVMYRAVYDYQSRDYFRIYTEYSGRILPFKVWHELAEKRFYRGSIVKLVPLFLKSDEGACEIVNGRPCYICDDKKSAETPRFLGVYVYKLSGKKFEIENFSNFVPAEKMKEKGINYK